MAPKPEVKMNPWLSTNPSKRWTELFFLLYSPFWIIWALLVVVEFQLYEYCGNYGYMAIGLSAALPLVILPIFLQPKGDLQKPWHRRYWVKANVWIAIFSFIGNYFWTHYFYKLLGASYTFVSWRLNDVPICLYLMTHAYFCFYHAISNMLVRRVRNAFAKSPALTRQAAMALVIFVLAYATAYGETLTIAHFRHYTFLDRGRMYSIGSLFYAIYFFVSFPLFFEMDEDQLEANGRYQATPRYTMRQAIVDSLAAGMAVTIILDFWRITFGGIISGAGATDMSLPFMSEWALGTGYTQS